MVSCNRILGDRIIFRIPALKPVDLKISALSVGEVFRIPALNGLILNFQYGDVWLHYGGAAVDQDEATTMLW